MSTDGVLLGPTRPGTELDVTSRSGVPLVVVAERVGLPFRAAPWALSLLVVGSVVAAFLAATWDEPGGPEPGLLLSWLLTAATLLGWWLVHRLLSSVQRWAVRRWSPRWKVAVLAPDPGTAPRGRWVLHTERLPAGVDPRERLRELVEEVRVGRFDANRRVLGLRASIRR